MSATGKRIEVIGAPVWTPEVLAALADMAVRDLTEQRTSETELRTPEPERLAA